MSYSIGLFNFIDFNYPQRGSQGVHVDIRPGVEGQGIWLTGVRGRPINVTTFRDSIDVSDAANTIFNYQAIIGSSVNVTWAGLDLPFQFDVLNVEPVGPRGGAHATVLGIGGILGVSNALAVANWTLMENKNARS